MIHARNVCIIYSFEVIYKKMYFYLEENMVSMYFITLFLDR